MKFINRSWMTTFAAAAFAAGCGLGLAGCEDNPFEDVGDSIEDTADDTKDAAEDAADETGDAIDDAVN